MNNKPRIKWDSRRKRWYTGGGFVRVTGETPAEVMQNYSRLTWSMAAQRHLDPFKSIPVLLGDKRNDL